MEQEAPAALVPEEPAAEPGATDGADAARAEPGQLCYGRVKSYNYSKGFGFLECPPVSTKFGRDVFLRRAAVAEEVLLSRIASGAGPQAVVQRGGILVQFTLLVNDEGYPEATNVHEVKRAEVPAELLEQLPALPAPAAPKAKAAPKAAGGSCRRVGAEVEASAEAVEARSGGQGKRRSKNAENKELVGEALQVGAYRCKVGKNAEDNWDILRAAKGKHWFFHLTDHPSAYIILECDREPSAEEKYLCAEICRKHSKQKLSGSTKVDATLCGNVSFGRKHDEVGECNYKNEDKVEIIVVT